MCYNLQPKGYAGNHHLKENVLQQLCSPQKEKWRARGTEKVGQWKYLCNSARIKLISLRALGLA